MISFVYYELRYASKNGEDIGEFNVIPTVARFKAVSDVRADKGEVPGPPSLLQLFEFSLKLSPGGTCGLTPNTSSESTR